MTMIEIPYDPENTDGWKVPIPGDGARYFASREAAMKFGVQLAKGVAGPTKSRGMLCVEGADGRWRLFTSDLLPIKQ